MIPVQIHFPAFPISNFENFQHADHAIVVWLLYKNIAPCPYIEIGRHIFGNTWYILMWPKMIFFTKMKMVIKWVIGGIFDWVFLLLAGDLPICKNCKWQIGHPFVSLNGVSSSGDHPFLFNFVGKKEFRATMCSWWFMLRVPPWCRKSHISSKMYGVHPIKNLIKKTSLLV